MNHPVYQCPGMYACPFSPGRAFPLFDVNNNSYFYGLMPQAELNPQPYYALPHGGYAYYSGVQGLDAALHGLNLNASVGVPMPTPPLRQEDAMPPPPPRGPWNNAQAPTRPERTPQRHPRSSRPGRGFFSNGRGSDAASWRPRNPSSPERHSRTVNKGNSDNVKRTVYITDVDPKVTEEQLAGFFKDCGEVVDCRVCGDPNSAMRFAFIEFHSDSAAQAALMKNGAALATSCLKVQPSKTAIVPVNNQYLPRNSKEREQCHRTIYVANIDKKVDRDEVLAYFEKNCGPVNKIRLLGDWQHSTRIAFIEFAKAEGAKQALHWGGTLFGSLPLRISPSKTPVRDDPPPAERPRGNRSRHSSSPGSASQLSSTEGFEIARDAPAA